MDGKRDVRQDLTTENDRLRARIAELENDRLSLRLLESILDSSQDLIAAQDTHFRYLAFNAAYRQATKKVFGFDVEIGGSMIEGLAPFPVDQKKAAGLWKRAFQGESFTFVEQFDGLGEAKFFEGHWRPLYGAEGEIVGAAHIVRDVTERLRAEKALRQSEEEFRAFFENAAVGAVQLDREGRFQRVNRRFCRIVGYRREELLRMTPFDITHPEDRQRDREGFDDLLSGKRPDYRVEKRFIRPDGRPIWVQLSAGEIRDAQGVPMCTAAIFQDISERKAAEERLRTLAAVVESSGDFIGLATPEMQPFFVNEAGRRMVGLDSPEEVAQTSILDYYCPEDRPFVQCHVIPHLREHGRWSSEIRLRHFKTGEPILVQWNLFQIRDAAGRTLAWATVSPDLRERQRLEDALRAAKDAAEAANRAKSDFLARMSHEIRTPMTVFLAVLEHLLAIEQNPEHRELLEMGDSAAQKLRVLIDDILDLSRIEAGGMSLQEEALHFFTWLQETVDMFGLAARKKNLRLDLAISPEVPEIVIADAQRLGQILLNLLSNAIKFTEEGGISVAAKVSVGDLRITVDDTGIGIPEDKRHLLFQNFSQVEGGDTRRRGGSGLGLAICRGLVELMRGQIEMQPRPEGGSTFSVILPLKTP